MTSPWDSHRRKPEVWKPDGETDSEQFGTLEPPRLDDRFSTPPTPNKHLDADWEVPAADPSEPPTTVDDEGRTSLSSSGRIPIVLVGVAVLVASVVFVGLRIIRVSVTSETDTTVPNGESTPAVSTVPGQSLDTTTTAAGSIQTGDQPGDTNWGDLARSVVFVRAGGSCGWVGSGTLILDGSFILTNWHVSGGGECPLQVGLTENSSSPPSDFYPAIVVAWDSQIDLAIIRLQDSSGAPLVAPNRRPLAIADDEVQLGQRVRLLGYPVVREDQFESGELYTLTLTDGSVSGVEDFGMRSGYNPIDSRTNNYEVWGEYIKHTAKQNGGVSGGGAFNENGELVAVPTAGAEKLELMRSVRFAKVLIERLKK